VVYFNHLVGLITNYNVHVELIQVCHGKNCIQPENEHFHHQTGFKFKEETSKVLHFEQSKAPYGAENWTLWKLDQKYIETF
jgi:hypothetical protein